MWFDEFKDMEDLQKQYYDLMKLHHPDFFQDEIEKELQEEIVKEIKEEYEQKKKQLEDSAFSEIESKYIAPKKKIDWQKIKDDMTPEQKQAGEEIVNKTLNFAGSVLSNIINKKLFR